MGVRRHFILGSMAVAAFGSFAAQAADPPRTLPLVVLPEAVLFPGQPLTLSIVQPRDRKMMGAVLNGDGRLGVVLKTNGKPAAIGCTADILYIEQLGGGGFNMLTQGGRRFRVGSYTQRDPFLLAAVDWLAEGPSGKELEPLVIETKQLLQDVVGLSSEALKRTVDLPKLPSEPREFSYWMASRFYGDPGTQQMLLEIPGTAERLQKAKAILLSTRQELIASLQRQSGRTRAADTPTPGETKLALGGSDPISFSMLIGSDFLQGVVLSDRLLLTRRKGGAAEVGTQIRLTPAQQQQFFKLWIAFVKDVEAGAYARADKKPAQPSPLNGWLREVVFASSTPDRAELLAALQKTQP
ncbi:LON peptidase substrate-binding domain-containing protein [Gloeobacter morelensis]|uniref:LON peptidase substrate-binding domain-containing protein n=1 Tax=Gloeobacter morelensis MG652769 TaxID=2781736 RepID=A0ABY3PLC9_9CYAN|nr:LON peptidase substrate-binding domain-containing protein [Gloeobacter morelensis]UFP94404.1 LON peptidase substrate-binding domain-containing protein [Gloeobacter morelensis MG652769]